MDPKEVVDTVNSRRIIASDSCRRIPGPAQSEILPSPPVSPRRGLFLCPLLPEGRLPGWLRRLDVELLAGAVVSLDRGSGDWEDEECKVMP